MLHRTLRCIAGWLGDTYYGQFAATPAHTAAAAAPPPADKPDIEVSALGQAEHHSSLQPHSAAPIGVTLRCL